MSAEAAIVSRTVKVGDQYEVTFTLPKPRPGAVMYACAEWSPHVPKSLTETELAQYREGRSEAMRQLAEALGLRSLVIDL